jgi:hypothetical protein
MYHHLPEKLICLLAVFSCLIGNLSASPLDLEQAILQAAVTAPGNCIRSLRWKARFIEAVQFNLNALKSAAFFIYCARCLWRQHSRGGVQLPTGGKCPVQ